MSQVRNVSGGPLDVPVLGRVVEAGEIAEVPDFQPDGTSPLLWHPPKWETIPDAPAKKADIPSGKGDA